MKRMLVKAENVCIAFLLAAVLAVTFSCCHIADWVSQRVTAANTAVRIVPKKQAGGNTFGLSSAHQGYRADLELKNGELVGYRLGQDRIEFRKGYLEDGVTYETVVRNNRVVLEHLYQNGKNTADVLGNAYFAFLDSDTGYRYRLNDATVSYALGEDGKLLSVEKEGVVARSYEYDGGKLFRETVAAEKMAYEVETDSAGKAVSIKHYRILNGKYFPMKKTAFQLLPADYNRDASYSREYTYEGKQYITKIARPGQERTFRYLDNLIVSESISDPATGEETTVDYLLDSSLQRIGFEVEGYVYYYVFDASGNVDTVIDRNGKAIAAYRYDLVGNIIGIEGEEADTVGRYNSFAFRARDNWYRDSEGLLYIGADTVYSSQYADVMSGSYPADFIRDPVNITVKDGQASAIDWSRKDAAESFNARLKDKVVELVANSLMFENLSVVKNILTSDDETDEISPRIDLYVCFDAASEKGTVFGNQGYFVAGDSAQEIADAKVRHSVLIENGDKYVYNGGKNYFPDAGQIGFSGHFIYLNQYVTYRTLEDSDIIVYRAVKDGSGVVYDESLGNLFNFDTSLFTLYFGSNQSYEGIEIVSNMVYQMDWDQIHQSVMDSLPKYEGIIYEEKSVEVYYFSPEYLEALQTNSRKNIFFGKYTADQLMEQYGDDWNFIEVNGEFVHHTEYEASQFNWDNFIKIALGTAMIVVAATVTALTAGAAAPATIGCIIGTTAALMGTAVVGGAISAAVEYCQTGSTEGMYDAFANGFFFTAVVASTITMVGGVPVACFPAGTPVLTSLGAVGIEQIKPGDMVLAYNIEEGRSEYRRVAKTFARETQTTLEVVTAQNRLTTTEEHPFYVQGKGWTKAAGLSRGDLLLRSDGSADPVSYVRRTRHVEPVAVYNIEVEQDHNYFVGEAPLLVHNSCGGEQLIGQGIAAGGQLINTISEQLAAAGLGIGVIGALIVKTVIDTGTITLPNSVTFESEQAKRIAAMMEKVAALEAIKKLTPGDEILYRYGRYKPVTFTPRLMDAIIGAAGDINENEDKRGVSFRLVPENRDFCIVLLSKLKKELGQYGLMAVENYNSSGKIAHVAVRPIEVDIINAPQLLMWARTHDLLVGQPIATQIERALPWTLQLMSLCIGIEY